MKTQRRQGGPIAAGNYHGLYPGNEEEISGRGSIPPIPQGGYIE